MEYFRNQPSSRVFDNVLLTSAFTGNRSIFDTAGFVKLTLDIDYVRGGGESASRLEFQLEHSPDDGATWHSLVIDTTGATSVIVPRVWELSGTNRVNVIVDIAYKRMRLSLREAGVVTNFGRATITVTPSGL